MVVHNDDKRCYAIVGEVQFLISWMLEAKKMGHRMYGVTRREEFIQKTNDMLSKDDDNNRYKRKISKLIEKNNYSLFSYELQLNESRIVTMMIQNKPLLLHINKCKFYRALGLVYSSILRISKLYSEDNLFLQTYINFYGAIIGNEFVKCIKFMFNLVYP